MKKNRMIGITICAAMVMTSITALAAENEPAVAAYEPVLGVPQITVDGKTIDFSRSGLSQYIFEENGNAMVPVRAVAEKMGFTVGWDGENRAITVGNDVWEARAYIGEDLYSGVTKIQGAAGMTSPQSYGAAPVIYEDTAFVPARMFEIMDYKSHSVGQFVDFRKVGVITDENGQEYRNDTLIISVSPNAGETEITELLELNGLEVMYKMDTLNMLAVKTDMPMTAGEMDSFIAELEKNESILAANKDYITHLDDNE